MTIEPRGEFLGEIEAPAKVNLSLRVLGRRPDGYHELIGVMARVGLCDRVRVYLAGPDGPGEDTMSFESRIGFPFGETLGRDPGFSGPGNLALRAIRAFREKTGFPQSPALVSLDKAIPLGAGLGGGSSDAAAVLRLLSQGYGRLPLPELKLMARDLGGDVPFFLEESPICWAGGIGERLWPYEGPRPGTMAILVNPGLEVSTAKVFGQLGLTFCPGSISLIPHRDMGPGPGPGLPAWGENDLEKAALSLCPALAIARDMISSTQPLPAHFGLSGSGATYWAIHNQPVKAQMAYSSLSWEPGLWVRLVTLGE
ncbi:MAG: 4-(cytidine 5'-diphospho)-2-C-methyl-D-erythritol kinase [Deltaproteobacteria bacterium]|nr:4-(cytidine 5'-diphospho)-2-C-methyl-D-erythritol kinase [Deltaproteobacteria bacterium]